MRGTTSSGYALALDGSYISSDSFSIVRQGCNGLQDVLLLRIL